MIYLQENIYLFIINCGYLFFKTHTEITVILTSNINYYVKLI